MLSGHKIQQLQYESDSWKRNLAFMIDENIHMKARLVVILRDKLQPDLLDEVEKMQNSFIELDNVIALLRNHIAEFDSLLTREIFEDGFLVANINRTHRRIEENVGLSKNKIDGLKKRFNDFVLDNF